MLRSLCDPLRDPQLSEGVQMELAGEQGAAHHVAIMLANRPEYFEIAWGAQRAGTYWTPVNWHLTADEAAYIVADSGATVLFASPETAEVAARMPGVTVFVTGGERQDLPGVAS